MSGYISVDRGRTMAVTVDFGGQNVSADTFTSDIRVTPSSTSTLIASWTVDATNAATGFLVLRLDNTITAAIPATTHGGFMDLKRVIGGEPTSVFDPLSVVISEVPTA